MLAAALVLASALPFVWPALPPLVDLPAHMARYRVALDVGESAELQRYFGYHWRLMGNLGVDLLVQPLARLIGLERAVKLIVLTLPALTAAGLLGVARAAHGRLPPTAMLAVPFALSAPLLFGFVNFVAGAALALIVFAAWLRGRSGLLLLLAGPVLFAVHLYGWAMLGLWVAGAVIGEAAVARERASETLRLLVRATLPLAPVLLLVLIARGSGGGPLAETWFDGGQKLVSLMAALRDRWALLDLLPVVVVLVVLITGWRRLGVHPALAGAALLTGVAGLLLPYKLMGSAYADMRLYPYALALAVLALRGDRLRPRSAQMLATAALGCALLRVGTVTASNLVAHREQQELLSALELMPAGARLATFVGQDCEARWPMQRSAHLGAMVTVRRDGFSNDQWAASGLNLLERRYRPPGGFDSDPSQLVQPPGCVLSLTVDGALAQFPREAFDFVWLIGTERPDPRLLAGLTPVWRGAGATLYRIVPDRGAAARAAGKAERLR